MLRGFGAKCIEEKSNCSSRLKPVVKSTTSIYNRCRAKNKKSRKTYGKDNVLTQFCRAIVIANTTICHYHHPNHHQLSLSSSQPPPSVTIIITTTTICHYCDHNHNHLSLLLSQPPPSVTIIIRVTAASHNHQQNHLFIANNSHLSCDIFEELLLFLLLFSTVQRNISRSVILFILKGQDKLGDFLLNAKNTCSSCQNTRCIYCNSKLTVYKVNKEEFDHLLECEGLVKHIVLYHER